MSALRCLLGALLAFVCWNCAMAERQDDPRPNLIYIMADDLGYGDIGCFGQQVIQTPHLDALAAEGLKLTNYYASNTVCRPSRLSLWTGKHCGHTAIDSNSSYVFRPEDVTVGERLQAAGYVTGGVGKWSMGNTQNSGHPDQNGFDFWMGYLDQSRAHNYYPEYLWRNRKRYVLSGNVVGDYANGRGRVSSTRTTYSHDVMTEQMLDFVREQRDRAFLLHVHWTIPHANNEGGRVLGDGMEVPDYGAYAEQDWPSVEKGHAAMISRMDADVGRLVGLLKELDLESRTLLIFTSDNGPHQEGGHQLAFFDSNGPLRGFKRDLYEGGIRVPTIARWPGKIRPGTENPEPLAAYDWLPTACELAEVPAPDGIDGISFVPLLMGESQPSHDYLFWSYGDKKAVRRGSWKAVIPGQGKPLELYDLGKDLGESTNVAARFPELAEELEHCIAAAEKK